MNPVNKARRELNKAMGTALATKLLLVLAGISLSAVLTALLRWFCGGGATAAREQFTSYATLSGVLLEIALFVLCLALPIALYFFFSRKSFSEVVPTKKPEFMQICFGVGATVTVGQISAIVGTLLLNLLFQIFGLGDRYVEMQSDTTEYPTNFWVVILFAIMLSVLPAFFEEILMRGIILSATKRFGFGFALFFNGFVFAFLHNTWTQLPFAFATGIVLAYFTLRFNTIWIAVISHFVFNFNSVVLSLILQNGGEAAETLSAIWVILFFTLMIGLLVAGWIIYGIRKPDLPRPAYSSGTRTAALLTSPVFWLFVAAACVQLILLLIR